MNETHTVGRSAAAAPSRCIWSGQRDAGTREVVLRPDPVHRPEAFAVCPAHEAEFLAFHERVFRRQYRFLAGMGVIVVAAIAAALIGEPWAAAIALVFAGTVVFVYPFATPQTVALVGVRRSIALARGLALLTVGLGVYLLLAAG